MFCTGNRRKLHIRTTEIRRKRKMDIVKMNHQNDYLHRVRSSFLEISITDCKISKPEFFLSRKGLTFAGLGGGHKHRKQKTTCRAYIYSMASGGHGTVVNAPLK